MAHVYVDSAAVGANNGSTKADAYTTLDAALTAKAAGDNFWVSHTHAQTQASSLTLTCPGTFSNPCTIISVNFAGSTPPVSADITPGATITTTGAFGITIVGTFDWEGIDLNAGTGATTAFISYGSSTSSRQRFKNCNLEKLGTSGSTSAHSFGGASNGVPGEFTLENVGLGFGSVNDTIQVRSGRVTWRDTTTPIASATLPTTLIQGAQTLGAHIRVERVDLSALGSGKTLIGNIGANQDAVLADCKLGASVTKAATLTGGARVSVIRCNSGAVNYSEEHYSSLGNQVDETIIIRTGGASDGTVGKSWKITTTSTAKWLFPFEVLPIAIWQDTTGGSKTATIEGVIDAAALPTNDELWFDLAYLGSSATPIGSLATGTKADYLATGSNLTASTEAWDSQVTARANTTAYSLGDVRKVASNPGRIFFCTTAGTSAGSEPAGYASAVDGGSVTDNTAVFRAGVRFKQSISFTPEMKGPIYGYLKAAKASTIWYVDPKITVT